MTFVVLFCFIFSSFVVRIMCVYACMFHSVQLCRSIVDIFTTILTKNASNRRDISSVSLRYFCEKQSNIERVPC